MLHVAIDLASKESQVCVRQPDGSILRERRLLTASLPRFLAKLEPARVVMESSSEAFAVADAALAAGHQVRVVPASIVRALGVGARGVKNDRRDAQALSEVSCRIDLPSVHIPTLLAREWRALATSRRKLVGVRTALINNVRGWLRTQTRRVPGRYPKTFPTRVRALLLQHPDGMPMHIEALLLSIDAINVQVQSLEEQLELATSDDLFQRLMTIPGVGKVTALQFVAVVDIASRFPNVHALQSYIGLVPGERSSGASTRVTGITKAGPRELRAVLIQAAWSALRSRRHRNDPMIRWARRLADRRNPQIAAVALARKLAGLMLAIWRDGSRYDPTRGADTTSG